MDNDQAFEEPEDVPPMWRHYCAKLGRWVSVRSGEPCDQCGQVEAI